MKIKINEDHSVVAGTFEIGREEENNVEVLEVEVPEQIGDWGICLEFELPDKTKYLSEHMDVSAGRFEYTVPAGLLTEKGSIKCQLSATNGDAVWKSSMWEMVVGQSVNADNEIPLHNPDWLSRVEGATSRAEIAAAAAQEAANVALNSQGPKGDKGDTGASMRFRGEWSENGVEYVCNEQYIDIVNRLGDLYRCEITHTSAPNISYCRPEKAGSPYWELVMPKGEDATINGQKVFTVAVGDGLTGVISDGVYTIALDVDDYDTEAM